MGGFVHEVPEWIGGELRIDRYTVEAKLGEGGMADVWLCRMSGARGFSKQVVIKTIKPACRSDHYESMFVDEANIGSRLEHPGIPRVTEFAQTSGGDLFLVQEYVEGPSVQQLIAAQRALGRYDLRLAAKIGAEVASALDFAFRLKDERGRPLDVVHRDVSSSNILVSRRGSAKLIDFGVARFADRETQTATGILKGKLSFMAPEIVSGSRPSHRSDLYSLGQVLYRLCVGRAPEGLVGSADFLLPSQLQPDIDPALESILVACLQPNPENRVASGQVLAQRLERWMLAHGGPVTDAEAAARIASLFPAGNAEWAPPSSEPGLTPRPRERAAILPVHQRARTVLLAAGVGLGLLGVATIVLLVLLMRAPSAAPTTAGHATEAR